MKRTKGIATVLAAVLILSHASAVFAWNDTGHQIISLMAYRQLEPKVKVEIDRLLKSHPRYYDDLLGGMKVDPAAEAQIAFDKSSTWPDIVRDLKNPAHYVHHKGPWHYIDRPYRPQGEVSPSTQPVLGPEPKPGEPANSVEAFNYNLKRLADPDVSDADRAVALCWVLHLGGDIHQPLHNCTMYNVTFPVGDKGGNAQFVSLNGKALNLHAVWDGWLGRDSSLTNISDQADKITAAYGKDGTAAVAGLDPEVWSSQGHELAVEYAYSHGKLQTVSDSIYKANPEVEVPALDAGYVAAAKDVSQKQAAIAAARTAAAINQAFSAAKNGGINPSPQPPLMPPPQTSMPLSVPDAPK